MKKQSKLGAGGNLKKLCANISGNAFAFNKA
jgi:hypothetical protein